MTTTSQPRCPHHRRLARLRPRPRRRPRRPRLAPRRRRARVPATSPPPCRGAVVVPGDVTDPAHRAALAAAVDVHGRLDLLVNNASDLGPSPLPSLARYPLDRLRRVYETNVVAPLALTQLLLPALRAQPRHRRRRQLRRRRRGLPGVGRLRAVQGRARPRQRRARRRGAGRDRLRRRPGRHAHRRCTRPRSRARTSATVPTRRTSCRPCCGCSTQRPRAGGYRLADVTASRRGHGVSAQPSSCRTSSRRRAARRPGSACGCWSPGRTASSTLRFERLADALRTG